MRGQSPVQPPARLSKPSRDLITASVVLRTRLRLFLKTTPRSLRDQAGLPPVMVGRALCYALHYGSRGNMMIVFAAETAGGVMHYAISAHTITRVEVA